MFNRLFPTGLLMGLFLLLGCFGGYKVYEADIHDSDSELPPVGVRHVVIPEGASVGDTNIQAFAKKEFEKDDLPEIHFSFYTDKADARARACERTHSVSGTIIRESCDGVINTNRPI